MTFSTINETLKDFETKHNVVIIKSSNDDVFKSSNDYNEIMNSSITVVKDRFRNEYQSLHQLSNYNIPVIALHCGLTTCDWSMGAKFRIATEKTIFSSKATHFGFFTDSGASYYLSRLESHLGMYIGLTGTPVKGIDVKSFGLATHYVDSETVRDLEHCLSFCETSEKCEEVLEDFSVTSVSKNSELCENLEHIEKSFCGLTVEQILENLKIDGSDWAKEATKTLLKLSPTSLKVCHRLLSLGRHMSLDDCAKLEWRLSIPFSVKSDLQVGLKQINGVKKWDPETVENVTERHLTRFFGPLTDDDDELKFHRKARTDGVY